MRESVRGQPIHGFLRHVVEYYPEQLEGVFSHLAGIMVRILSIF